jgi:CheY-like chemotaxis protein
MTATTILMVDDDEIIRNTMSEIPAHKGFKVTAATSVVEALGLIKPEVYDVLLTDLHMPGAGDGLTVATAMRSSDPKAVTMLLSSFPEMEAAAHAILAQADAILVQPIEISALVDAITGRLSDGSSGVHMSETVATIHAALPAVYFLAQSTRIKSHTFFTPPLMLPPSFVLELRSPSLLATCIWLSSQRHFRYDSRPPYNLPFAH